jgi:hypothetical protein
MTTSANIFYVKNRLERTTTGWMVSFDGFHRSGDDLEELAAALWHLSEINQPFMLQVA